MRIIFFELIICSIETSSLLLFTKLNVFAKSFNSSLLWEPWTIKNKSGNFYKVFTPFFKKGCLETDQPRIPFNKPKELIFLKLFKKDNINKELNKFVIRACGD